MAKKHKDKLTKILVVALLICFSIITYLSVVALVFFRKIDLPIYFDGQLSYYNAIDILQKEYDEIQLSWTNDDYKSFVEQDMGLRLCFYKEKPLDGYYGKAYATIKLIVIDDSIEGYQYCVTFVHEATHIKQLVANERYVCFEVFKYLYENQELHNIGVWYGIRQLYGYYGGEYNIADLIVDYLTNK